MSGAVIWRRFWRPAAARTGPCGQPLLGGKCERFPIMCRSGAAVPRAVAARFLPDSCPVPARFLPSGRFLPGSCPVPAQFLPDRTAGQDPPRSTVWRFLRRSWAATGRTTLGCCTTLACGCFLPYRKAGRTGTRVAGTAFTGVFSYSSFIFIRAPGRGGYNRTYRVTVSRVSNCAYTPTFTELLKGGSTRAVQQRQASHPKAASSPARGTHRGHEERRVPSQPMMQDAPSSLLPPPSSLLPPPQAGGV